VAPPALVRRPLRGLCDHPDSRAGRCFPPPPRGAVLANGPHAVKPPARTCLAAQPVVRCFSRQLASRPSTTGTSSATRPLRCHLRPAGQRPTSRRLSRSPSAPERTLNVLHRRRWARTHVAVLSGAEAARHRHRRLACRRPPVPRCHFYFATRISQTLAKSAESQNYKSARSSVRAAAFTRLLLDVHTSSSPASARRPCRACAEAHPTRLRRVRRSAPMFSAALKGQA
jgi:hypothetical protein